MRSPRFITASLAAAILLLFAAVGSAQRISVLTPNGTEFDKAIAAKFAGGLAQSKLQVQDLDISSIAFTAEPPSTPFNMTADEARRVGSVLGCDYFVLIDTGVQRRARLDAGDQFEAFAAVYVVGSKTGLLHIWKLISSFADTDEKARLGLSSEVSRQIAVIAEQITRSKMTKIAARVDADLDIPIDDDPAMRNYRSPVPYKRIKPEYTRQAYLYDVAATVEATVELGKTGDVRSIEITRWAGYGLDESVASAIRSMNWRPGERDGKPLAVRFMVRYNFRKLEKESSIDE